MYIAIKFNIPVDIVEDEHLEFIDCVISTLKRGNSIIQYKKGIYLLSEVFTGEWEFVNV